MKKLTAIIILLLLCILLTHTVAFAKETTTEQSTLLDELLHSQGFVGSYTIRSLQDLSGNLYLLVEYDQHGYAIIHPETYTFSEFSITSQSPYSGAENIVYGGPSFYFERKADVLQHVFTGETFSDYAILSNQSNTPDDLTTTYNNFNKLELQSITANSTYSTYASSVYQNVSPYYFSKLHRFGSNSSGSCGYLASSILLSYYANFHNPDFVNQAYITPQAGPSYCYDRWLQMPALSNDLHLELIDIGKSLNYGLGSTGTTMKNVLERYYNNHNLKNIKVSLLTSPFFIDAQMRNIIDSGNPMLMFGELKLDSEGTKDMHVVVCYGYHRLDGVTYYRVHMGYPKQTDVYLTNLWSENIFGQIYSIKYTGTHKHSNNFIYDNESHCGCAYMPDYIA